MDNWLGRFGFAITPSSNVFKTLNGVVQAGADNHMDTILRLDSPLASGLCFAAKGTKRKWGAVDGSRGLEYDSLALGLGHPASSSDSKGSSATACTMSSARETDEESSTDIGLNFQLHIGNEKTSSPKKTVVTVAKAAEMELEFDLQLSLSTGSAESEITSNTSSSALWKNKFEVPLMPGRGLLWEKGSTSSNKNLETLFPMAKMSSVPCSVIGQTDSIPAASVPSASLTSMPKSSVTCNSGLTQQKRSVNAKTCQFEGCGKGARGASGLCIAHGGGRRCQKEGCHKGAEGRTVYCKAHGGGRRCHHLGCTKSAEGRTDYCIAHGGGRRCNHEGCTRAARGKSGLCIRHGGGKRCQKENCTKSAEGFSGLCISHGGGRRCQFLACTKGAQGSTKFCKAHGGGKRCTVDGCTKGAEGSTPFCKGHGGGKRCSFEGGCTKSVHGGTLFCVAHGGGKRCAMLECTKSARGRTDFCVRHGGGKRCKYDGCGKSAQGSTDFCKAHGGGKRCTWANGNEAPCERFARGKTGLCAAHSALVQDKRVHGGGTLGCSVQEPEPGKSEIMKDTASDKMIIDPPKEKVNRNNSLNSISFDPKDILNPVFFMQMQGQVYSPVSAKITQPTSVDIPEGRVHGGALMAMLKRGGRD